MDWILFLQTFLRIKRSVLKDGFVESSLFIGIGAQRTFGSLCLSECRTKFIRNPLIEANNCHFYNIR